MNLRRIKFRLWMLEIPVWLAGLLWVMSAGADRLPPNLQQPLPSSSSQQVQDPLGGAARPRTQAAYGRLPLGFESNQGQADASIRFLSRTAGAALFFTSNEVVLQLGEGSSSRSTARTSPQTATQTRIRMHLLGSHRNPVILAEE